MMPNAPARDKSANAGRLGCFGSVLCNRLDVYSGTSCRNSSNHVLDRVLYQRALDRSEEHTSELQSRLHLVCRLLLEKKKKAQALNAAEQVLRFNIEPFEREHITVQPPIAW